MNPFYTACRSTDLILAKSQCSASEVNNRLIAEAKRGHVEVTWFAWPTSLPSQTEILDDKAGRHRYLYDLFALVIVIEHQLHAAIYLSQKQASPPYDV